MGFRIDSGEFCTEICPVPQSTLHDILDHTLFGLDVRSMLSGVEDFLKLLKQTFRQERQRELDEKTAEAYEAVFEDEDEASGLGARYR